MRPTGWRHKFANLGEGALEAALGLHAYFEGVQRVDGALRSCARHCPGDDVAGRLGVHLQKVCCEQELYEDRALLQVSMTPLGDLEIQDIPGGNRYGCYELRSSLWIVLRMVLDMWAREVSLPLAWEGVARS